MKTMLTLNKLLKSQVQKNIGNTDELPEPFLQLLQSVSETYDQFENALNMQKHAIELSSDGVPGLNAKMINENSILGIAWTSLSGHLIYVNDTFCRMMEYTKEELRNMHFTEYSNAEDNERDLAFFKKLAEGEIHNYTTEKRYITKKGKTIWVELHISNIRNEAGKTEYKVSIVKDITSRKSAENALRKSEINLHSIIENTDAFVYSLNREFQYITFNNLLKDTMKEKYNIDIEPGVKVFAFLEKLDPAEAENWRTVYSEALGGKTQQFVKDYSTDEFPAYVSFAVHPIWENKNVIGLSCFARDITPQKLAERSLQKSEANLRNILENTNTAFVLLDTDANILSFNRLAQKLAMAELGTELIEGRNYINIMRAERKVEAEEIIQNVLKNGVQVNYETTYSNPDGSFCWLDVSVHPILNDDRQVLGLSIAATNITDRKKIEQEIKRSNERYELVTKATNDVIWDWDVASNKMYRSENYLQIFGSDSSENTSSWEHRIHPEDRNRVSESIMEAINNPDALLWEDEYRYFRKNGEIAYVKDRAYIIHNEDKKQIRMVGAMKDITSEKLTDQKLEEKIKELNTFIYRASHDLKGPLSSIIGLTNLANTVIDNEEALEFMQMIGESTQKLDHILVSLIRTMSMKDSKMEVETIDFGKTLPEVISLFEYTENFKRVNFKLDIQNRVPFSTDGVILNTILRNIIENGIKYHGYVSAHPFIEIKVMDYNNGVKISISDNGKGMDPVTRDKAFDMFYRGNSNSQGSGLGLYIVKKAVERLGGIIELESVKNNGTSFTVMLENIK